MSSGEERGSEQSWQARGALPTNLGPFLGVNRGAWQVSQEESVPTNLSCVYHQGSVCRHCLVGSRGPLGAGGAGHWVDRQCWLPPDPRRAWRWSRSTTRAGTWLILFTAVSPALMTESGTQHMPSKCLLLEKTKSLCFSKNNQLMADMLLKDSGCTYSEEQKTKANHPQGQASRPRLSEWQPPVSPGRHREPG